MDVFRVSDVMIDKDEGRMSESEHPVERSVRLILISAPAPTDQLRVGEVFRISALVRAQNVSRVKVSINFEPEFVQLVDSPQEIELRASAYDETVEWLVRALSPTTCTSITLNAWGNGIPQVAECPVRIIPSNGTPSISSTGRAI